MSRRYAVIAVLSLLATTAFAQTFEPDSVVRLTSSAFEDFSAVPYGKGLVYVSARENVNGRKIAKDNNQGYFALFMLDVEKGESRSFEDFGLKRPRFNYGPITFLNEKTGAFYSFNRRKATKGEFKFTIQYLDFKTGKSKDLPFVSKKYNYQHPFFDKDNRRLYFASDMQGGKGGYDIYYAEIDAKGNMGVPVNVQQVNTVKNEVFPTAIGSEIYFSRPVLENGLDILSYSFNEQTEQRLEAPFNSSGDDHSLVFLASDSAVFTQGIKGTFNSDIFLAYNEQSDKVLEGMEPPLFVHQTQDIDGVGSNDSLLISNDTNAEQTDRSTLGYEEVAAIVLAQGDETEDSPTTQIESGSGVGKVSEDTQKTVAIASIDSDNMNEETVNTITAQDHSLEGSIVDSQEGLLVSEVPELTSLGQDASGSRTINAPLLEASDTLIDDVLVSEMNAPTAMTDTLAIVKTSAPILESKEVNSTALAKVDEAVSSPATEAESGSGVGVDSEHVQKTNPTALAALDDVEKDQVSAVARSESLNDIDVDLKDVASREESESVVSNIVKKESDDYVSSSPGDNFNDGLKKRTITLEYSNGQLQLAEKQSKYLKEAISKDAVESLLIEGHTDSKGRKSYNEKLALLRALDVRNLLVHEIGVPEQRISLVSWGEQKPKIYCTKCSEEQSRRNRRVEITLNERIAPKVDSSDNAVEKKEPLYVTYRFAKDQVALKYEKRAELKELLGKVPFDKMSVRFTIHTDGVGNKSVNENLSVLRAAELQYLIKKSLGDSIAEIEIEMVADESPFASIGGGQQDYEWVAAENRRIDIQIAPYLSETDVNKEHLVVFFDFDRSSFQRKYLKQLQDLSESLKSDEDVVLYGYADDRGEEGYNFILSLERALSVKKKILKINPQYAGNVKIVARGESFSGDAKSNAEHARNRKVELFKSGSYEN